MDILTVYALKILCNTCVREYIFVFLCRSKMAEAHSAVAFSFTVTHEGVNLDLNYEAIRAIWRSGVRSWKKRMGRMKVSHVMTSRLTRWLSLSASDRVSIIKYSPYQLFGRVHFFIVIRTDRLS